MTTIIEDRAGLREFAQDRLDFGVVGGYGPALAEVAGRAGQDEVAQRVLAAHREREQMVEVKYPAFAVVELEEPAFRDHGSLSPPAAVVADAPVAFRDFVSQALGDVFGSGFAHRHNPSDSPGGYPCRDALLPSFFDLIDRMCDPEDA